MSGRGIFGEAAGRRRYRMGRTCQDCGRGWLPTTLIRWWIGGTYWVCSDCIEPYRAVILHPDPKWRRGARP